jgi:outer membrane protein assembly factor BamB
MNRIAILLVLCCGVAYGARTKIKSMSSDGSNLQYSTTGIPAEQKKSIVYAVRNVNNATSLASNTLFTFNATLIDTNNEFENSLFTAKRKGLYLVCSQVTFTCQSGTSQAIAYFRQNGSDNQRMLQASSPPSPFITGGGSCFIFDANAGDNVGIGVLCASSGGADTMHGPPDAVSTISITQID